MDIEKKTVVREPVLRGNRVGGTGEACGILYKHPLYRARHRVGTARGSFPLVAFLRI